MRLVHSPLFLVPVAALSLAGVGCGTSATPAAQQAAGESPHAQAPEPAERFARVTIEQVEAKLASGTVHVFDNNDRETYEAGHVPGARWVNYDSVQASDLPADRAAELVFYCANEYCSACHTAADAAIALGYTNVSIMPAGIQGWRAAGKPTVTGASPA